MQVVIRKITPFSSQYGGDVLRVDGFHVNELGELVRGYTFIDPKNDNARDWAEVLEVAHANRGQDIIVDGVKMKSRDKGLWSADSRPQVVEIVPRP